MKTLFSREVLMILDTSRVKQRCLLRQRQQCTSPEELKFLKRANFSGIVWLSPFIDDFNRFLGHVAAMFEVGPRQDTMWLVQWSQQSNRLSLCPGDGGWLGESHAPRAMDLPELGAQIAPSKNSRLGDIYPGHEPYIWLSYHTRHPMDPNTSWENT